MNDQDTPKDKIRIEFNGGFRQYFAAVFLFVLIFVLPVTIHENWTQISEEGEKVLGIATEMTDNRYYVVPLLNFKFDTELRESSTLIFIAGIFILVLGIIVSIVMWIDFRRKLKKYE